MDIFESKVLAQISSKSPTSAECYFNDSLAIFRPTSTVQGEAVFSSYHFILPLDRGLPLSIEGKAQTLEKLKLFALNPYQHLQVLEKPISANYLAIFVDPKFWQEIAAETIGSGSRYSLNNHCYSVDDHLFNLVRRFGYECENAQSGYRFVLKCLSAQIVVHLLRSVHQEASPRNVRVSAKHGVKQAISFIRQHYHEGFTLDELALAANLSPYYLIRVFRAQTGKTPFDYLIDVKVEKAKELLASNHCNVTEVAMECGFSSPSHFSHTFKQRIGVSPSQFRKALL